MKQSKSVVPTFDSMFVPTIQALQALGGSGTTEEIYEQVVQILNLADTVLEALHGNNLSSMRRSLIELRQGNKSSYWVDLM